MAFIISGTCLMGQGNIRKYIPASVNSPLFTDEKEVQVQVNANNYGTTLKLAGCSVSKLLIFTLLHNSGEYGFNPLNFHRNYPEDNHYLQTFPSPAVYTELGMGHQINHPSQKMSVIAGLGREFQNRNSRIFIQFDWGNENSLVNSGASMRVNYTCVDEYYFLILEPSAQFKFKVSNWRIVNQFGYSIPLLIDQKYMKPLLSVGVEYVFGVGI